MDPFPEQNLDLFHMTATTDFRDYSLTAPTYEEVSREYQELTSSLENTSSAEEAIAIVESWDALRRRLDSWSALVAIRFHQDTQNTEYKQNREYCDQLRPKLTNLGVSMKRQLLEGPHRSALADRFGKHVFDLWRCDLASFDPVIEDDLVEESRLDAQYTELLASGKFEFQGETLTLSEMAKFAEHPDREVRHEAAQLRWGWFHDNMEQLDTLFDQLVRLRQRMAEKLGYKNFIPLGYQQMQRIDYDQEDVDKFRAEVRQHVVPLSVEIRQQQGLSLGIDPLMAWDEGLHDSAGNPQPKGDHDWMIARATEMFQMIGGGLDDFFDQMCQRQLMDLKSRKGKAGGGFCDVLPDFGMPFIFANFNGTKSDVETFTHEMGHAFQVYCSLRQPISDYFWPTTEACEIHSMSLEFLTWPQMDLFFGDDADRFRRLHLTQSLLFLPYGVAVDHFQHLVYADPTCTPQQRAEMWREMEQLYLPTLNWGDLEHPASGRRWQMQMHIYGSPFYYIDYTLALTCAMQLWVYAAEDRSAALEIYGRLCRRGGEAPFNDLVTSAGLTSPFAENCLAKAVGHARRQLDG